MLHCRHHQRIFIKKLQRIGEGYWRSAGDTDCLSHTDGLELWRTKLTKAGRIVWQVCIAMVCGKALVPATADFQWVLHLLCIARSPVLRTLSLVQP